MKYKVNLKGKVYEVEVERGEAILIDEYEANVLPAPVAATPVQITQQENSTPKQNETLSGNAVKAPLPGNIMSIKVNEGQSVKAGDLLLVIEAMKMENEVLAPADGTVKQIAVSKGQTVSTGDVLLTI